MPNPLHQRIAGYLFRLLQACVAVLRSGEVFFAPLPIRLWAGKYRDPDIAFLKPGRISDPLHQPQGADLVVEVVSDDEEGRQRDLIRNAKSMPRRALPNTGSSIPKPKRSPC